MLPKVTFCLSSAKKAPNSELIVHFDYIYDPISIKIIDDPISIKIIEIRYHGHLFQSELIHSNE